jgi:hypothetical protein
MVCNIEVEEYVHRGGAECCISLKISNIRVLDFEVESLGGGLGLN